MATLIDFQGWLAAQPGGELDPAKREDGLHFYDEFAPTIGAWLGPQVLDLARNGLPAPSAGARLMPEPGHALSEAGITGGIAAGSVPLFVQRCPAMPRARRRSRGSRPRR